MLAEGGYSRRQLIEEAKARGANITGRQLDRWRSAGLVPFEQSWQNPGRGSEHHYPASAVENLLAISAQLKKHRDLALVGWELWWLGFPVADRCWMPVVQRASITSVRVIAGIASLLRWRDQDDEYADERASAPIRMDLFPGAMQRTLINYRQNHSAEKLTSVISRLMETITDHPNAESWGAPDPDTESDRQALVSILGFVGAATDHVHGQTLDPSNALMGVLSSMRSLRYLDRISGPLSKDRKLELVKSRDELRTAFEMTQDFYAAVAWVYGPRAYGLKLATNLMAKATPRIAASMILGWAQMRASDHSRSSEAIACLRAQASDTLRLSLAVRAYAKTNPRFRQVLSAKRIRKALQTPAERAKWLQEIEQTRLS